MVFGKPRAAQRNSSDLLLVGERDKVADSAYPYQADELPTTTSVDP